MIKNFLKSIIIGIGGIAPGLSGSVMMIIFGIYQDTVDALGTIFKDFKKKFLFLLPIVAGMGVGMLLFSKIMNFFLTNFEMQTRFTFFGLILGTIPLFYKQVRKKGLHKRHYVFIILALAGGIALFALNPDMFPQIKEPNFLQKMLLGVAVITSSIVPGIDSAVILSTLGLYEIYVASLANLDFSVLLPMVLGACVGGLLVSFIVSLLFKYFYAGTFSVVFGLFLAMIPNIFNESCAVGLNLETAISIILAIIGFAISLFLSNAQVNIQRIKSRFGNKNNSNEKEPS